ncbi:MarR family transcriptional regulator [Streptomyces cinereoruber]|uniref:MarR family transcriptional regulator n=1 Tax=Streptomyces cinereoruber TaxID=67260 RepID=UPI00362C730A
MNTNKAIADMTGLNKGSVSKAVTRLISDGLVRKVQNGDRALIEATSPAPRISQLGGPDAH